MSKADVESYWQKHATRAPRKGRPGEAAGIPASAMWVQDWGGIRLNPDGGFGVQYVWNADEELYPSFGSMVSTLHDGGYKFLAYVNPFIVDPDSVVEEDSPERFESSSSLRRRARPAARRN